MFEFLKTVYLIVAIVVGWMMISELQAKSGLVVFATATKYIGIKLESLVGIGSPCEPYKLC